MADYTIIPDGSLAPKAPITSEIGFGLRDNPTAIAEGAIGAPKIADKILSASGTTTFSSLDDFGGLWVRGVSNGDVLKVQFSDDGGVTFSSEKTILTPATGTGGASVVVELFINFSDGVYNGFAISTSHLAGGDSTPYTYRLNGTVTGMSSGVTDIKLIGLSAMLANPQGGETAS